MVTDAELIKAVDECRALYEHMNKLTTSVSRGNWGWAIVERINATPGLSLFVRYNSTKRAWNDRIVFDEIMIHNFLKKGMKKTILDKMANHEKAPFEDGIDVDSFPTYKGLYFLGDSRYNPETELPEFWVKIGKAINIRKRIKDGYCGCCSQIWPIGFSRDYDAESDYHRKLKSICLNTNKRNKEWFMVDKETYFEMCAKGFSYFD